VDEGTVGRGLTQHRRPATENQSTQVAASLTTRWGIDLPDAPNRGADDHGVLTRAYGRSPRQVHDWSELTHVVARRHLGEDHHTFVLALARPVSPPRVVISEPGDAELHRRGGFVSSARQVRRESEVLTRREGELAEGHACFLSWGYLTMSAASDDLFVFAVDALHQRAGPNRLALRRLSGDQA
jgi:hypothetical protein